MTDIAKERDRLIRIISSRGDRYGYGSGSSIECMDKYNVHRFPAVTLEQLREFVALYDWMDAPEK